MTTSRHQTIINYAQLILWLLTICAFFYIGYLAQNSFAERAALRADQRLTQQALDKRGNLFVYDLNRLIERGEVPKEKLERFMQMRREAGLPDKSTLEDR